jgi:hypothetical protein
MVCLCHGAVQFGSSAFRYGPFVNRHLIMLKTLGEFLADKRPMTPFSAGRGSAMSFSNSLIALPGGRLPSTFCKYQYESSMCT